MARLPRVGEQNWGQKLNGFLLVSHRSDGTPKLLSITRGGTGAVSATQARHNLHVPTRLTINNVPGTTYTLSADDRWKYLRCTNAAGCDITIPANLEMVDCTEVHIRAVADGVVTLVPAVGVTINVPAGGSYQLAGRGAVISLFRVGTDEYDLIGPVVAA